MTLWFPLAAYVAGYFASARILWLTLPKRVQEEDGPFTPVVLGLLWPALTIFAVVAGLFWCIGWLVMLPHRRKAERAERLALAVHMAGRRVRR